MINFVTLAEMNKDVINSLYKIPHDIDIVVGVPRSGMLVASIIAVQLNKPLLDLNEYLSGYEYTVGLSTNIKIKRDINKVLIVEDSVLYGTSINRAKNRIEQSVLSSLHEYIYYAAYVSEITNSAQHVDVYARVLDNRVFEWNLMHHDILQRSCFDIDGVLCKDPTPEENDDGENYRNFMKNALPKYVPTKKIGWLVTSRLEKYRAETEEWLAKNHIEYDHLIMSQFKTAEERRRLGSHPGYKAAIYSQLPEVELFVESERWQAIEIVKRTNKPVYCTENQFFYTMSDFPKNKKIYTILRKIGLIFPKRIRKAGYSLLYLSKGTPLR